MLTVMVDDDEDHGILSAPIERVFCLKLNKINFIHKRYDDFKQIKYLTVKVLIDHSFK